VAERQRSAIALLWGAMRGEGLVAGARLWWRACRAARVTGLELTDTLALLRTGMTEAEVYTLCLRTGNRT
jgi:hypothetical protein